MMKFLTAATAIAGLPSARAISISVSSCTELARMDPDVTTELTVTKDTLICEDYTRIRIKSGLVLMSTASKLTFSNVAFKVWGDLTVEPDVVFTGVSLVVSVLPVKPLNTCGSGQYGARKESATFRTPSWRCMAGDVPSRRVIVPPR